MKRLASLATVALLATSLNAQTAIYNGRPYTPESYPRGANYTYPNCRMCNAIRQSWRDQGWISGYGSSKKMRASTASIAAPVATIQVASTPVQSRSYRTETRTRVVTKYRQVTTYEQRCVRDEFGRRKCQLVPTTRSVPYQATETYQVRVPVSRPTVKVQKTSDISNAPDGTPMAVVDAVLRKLNLSESDTLWDIGSGRDARVLITACQRYGCKGVGVEINESHASASRRLVESKGLGGKVKIITADGLDLSYAAARKVFLYQYPDLQEQILKKLSPGTLVGCYSHEPEGVNAKSHSVNGYEFFVGYVGSRRPPVVESNSLFGLDDGFRLPVVTSQPLTFGL